MRYLIVVLLIVLLGSCADAKDDNTLKSGEWRAVLHLDDSKEIPFLFDYSNDNKIIIYNGDEEIEVDDITLKNDSIIIEHPIFEGVFKGKFVKDSIYGDFIKPNLDRVVPFSMTQGRGERFDVRSAPGVVVTGNWETVFSPNSKTDRYIAKGIFEQTGHKVTGTFRTTTGDYRFLEGSVENDSLRLSTFDGAHAFLFEAKVKDSVMDGMFYSGNHWKEPFTAKRNDEYELPKADSLTFLKEGYEKIEFSFPDSEGNTVSLTDEKFNDKVVLVQVMGTWCPNCLDETRFYKEYLNDHEDDPIEIVALAFENAPTEAKANKAIDKFKMATEITYPILLAQYGTTDKQKANQKLPMLERVLSYPTTIFIDKKGKVRRIHTGFNGPATGKLYEEYTAEFENFVDQLMEE